MEKWAAVILAAGKGTRMVSKIPKVLHPLCGKEMIRYSVELADVLDADQIVVVVSPSNQAAIQGLLGAGVRYALQAEARGTADALAQAERVLGKEFEHLLVLNADMPLVKQDSVKMLMAGHLEGGGHMTLLTGAGPDVAGLGRVRRDGNGNLLEIIEAAEASVSASGPAEFNAGIYCFSPEWLWSNLPGIQPSGSGELYLTSLASIGSQSGANIRGVATLDSGELMGVNNRVQLAQAEAVARQRIREQWMLAGVTMADPSSVFIDADVSIGQDTIILSNTMILGKTDVGASCVIGPGSTIQDSSIGSDCRVTSSALEGATMEDRTDIGPFSHLRPGAYLESGVHVGNFAEVKESRLAAGVAMGHFGYVGDASIGRDVNLGAGLVTCNYDGTNKHRTIVEDGAFIGSDTMLVAPVTVGKGARTGAGSVITKDVPAGRLAVGVPATIRNT